MQTLIHVRKPKDPSPCTTMEIFKRVKLTTLEERRKENTWDAIFLEMGRTNKLYNFIISTMSYYTFHSFRKHMFHSLIPLKEREP
jgi:hypothetical protein